MKTSGIPSKPVAFDVIFPNAATTHTSSIQEKEKKSPSMRDLREIYEIYDDITKLYELKTIINKVFNMKNTFLALTNSKIIIFSKF
jgi:hypothetical protein